MAGPTNRVALFVLAILCLRAHGAPEEGIPPKGPPPTRPELPPPSETLRMLREVRVPAWTELFRPPIPATYSDRRQIALNLGTLFSDAALAVEARDAVQVKHGARDVLGLAKSLGIDIGLMAPASALVERAAASAWDEAHAALETLREGAKRSLSEQRDEHLLLFLNFGTWLRTLDIVSAAVARDYSGESARILEQTDALADFQEECNRLPERLRTDPFVSSIATHIGRLREALAFRPDEGPTPDRVAQLRAVAAGAIASFVRRPD